MNIFTAKEFTFVLESFAFVVLLIVHLFESLFLAALRFSLQHDAAFAAGSAELHFAEDGDLLAFDVAELVRGLREHRLDVEADLKRNFIKNCTMDFLPFGSL